MNRKAQIMLKALLAHTEHKDELYRFLSAELKKEVESLAVSVDLHPKILFSSSGWIQNIHFSWFEQSIASFPFALQPFFLGLLTPQQQKGISELTPASINLERSFKLPSPFLGPFLAQILRSEFIEPFLLNEEQLPPSILNLLLKFERKKLIHLCNLLGIHDLAIDLRQVVDKNLLEKVYKVLTTEQLHFLHYCSKQPIKWISPKLGLPSWDGSQKQLNKLLHHRGLIRLGKTIVKEDESFKWHLLHRFDTGRAKIIQKEFYKKQELALLPYFKNQVIHIAKGIADYSHPTSRNGISAAPKPAKKTDYS